MKDIKYIINYNIQVAEDLNKEKRKGINKLVNRIDDCPEQWKRQTKKFIDVVRNNIANRFDYISELRRLKSDDSSSVELFKIISKLEELDKKDSIVCDMYKAAMDEGIEEEL